jgi:hypothetical protein
MVLNKTSAKAIADLYGPKTEEWKGKDIQLFATTCQAFGKTVECIRVNNKAPGPGRHTEPEPDVSESYEDEAPPF